MKLLTSLMFLLIYNYCYGQSLVSNKSIVKNYIDSITTAEQIENLISKTGIDKYKNYRVNATLKFGNMELQKLCDSLKVKSWEKADFDGNGHTDILVTGSYGVICVFGKENDQYEIVPITYADFTLCSFSNVKIVEEKPEFDYYYFKSDPDSNRTYPPKTLHKVTLVYEFGDFMEKNTNLNKHKIEKIEFFANAAGWNSKEYNITINGDKSAIWESKYGSFHTPSGKKVEPERFGTKIIAFNFSYIIQLLNYIDFENLERFYTVPHTDDNSCELKITYDGGKVKTIGDYGCKGTYGLQRLYQLLFDLKQNQHWNRLY